MDLQLKDKTALVTGSTAGIGLAIASLLLQEGATVYINGRTTKRVVQAVEQLKRTIPGANVAGIAADFSQAGEVNDLLSQIPALDILINNVGIFEPKSFLDITDEDWLKSVLPGPTRSEGVGVFLEDLAKSQHKDSGQVEEEFFRTTRPTSLIQRFASPEEIAYLVAFVASPLSAATNGAALRVDGGIVKTIV